MRTWHRDAVEGLEVVIAEIERIEWELLPLLAELVEALDRTGRPVRPQLRELADGVDRLRRSLCSAERAVGPVQARLRAGSLPAGCAQVPQNVRYGTDPSGAGSA